MYVHIMFYTYLLANRKNGALYLGQTDDLLKRVFEHKTGRYSGHASKYQINRLVWYEIHETRDSAFIRERQIKKWNRIWKVKRIVEHNPHWDDLFGSLTEPSLCDPARMYPYDFSESDYQIRLSGHV